MQIFEEALNIVVLKGIFFDSYYFFNSYYNFFFRPLQFQMGLINRIFMGFSTHFSNDEPHFSRAEMKVKSMHEIDRFFLVDFFFGWMSSIGFCGDYVLPAALAVADFSSFWALTCWPLTIDHIQLFNYS